MNNPKKIRIGAITIGQSPRVDITGDICPLLAPNIELQEYGALDPFDKNYVDCNFSPKPNSDVLVTRMRDGSQVIIGEKFILSLIQDCIIRAEKEGCQAVALLCTGRFPNLKHHKMLIIPQMLIHDVLKRLADNRPVGILVPHCSQISQAQNWFKESNLNIRVLALSPYQETSCLREKIHAFREEGLSLVLPDCMGYSISIKKEIEQILSIPVLLPRTFLASLINELFASRP